MTGRSEQKLAALRAELVGRFPGCTVACFACDLTDAADRARLFAAVRDGGWRIFRLCNVAGADIQKAFCRYTQEKIAFQCRINFEAALCVTRFALENRVGTLEIVTVGSISGVYPMPYFAVYSAAKGALESFFTSLREEVRGQRVNVTTVEPGGVYTRPDVCRMIEGQGLWAGCPPRRRSTSPQRACARCAKTSASAGRAFGTKLSPCCRASCRARCARASSPAAGASSKKTPFRAINQIFPLFA